MTKENIHYLNLPGKSKPQESDHKTKAEISAEEAPHYFDEEEWSCEYDIEKLKNVNENCIVECSVCFDEMPLKAATTMPLFGKPGFAYLFCDTCEGISELGEEMIETLLESDCLYYKSAGYYIIREREKDYELFLEIPEKVDFKSSGGNIILKTEHFTLQLPEPLTHISATRLEIHVPGFKSNYNLAPLTTQWLREELLKIANIKLLPK